MESGAKDDRVLRWAVFATYSNNLLGEFHVTAPNEEAARRVFCDFKFPTSAQGDIFCNDQLVKFYLKELLDD